MKRGQGDLEPSSKPNFFEFVFGDPLTPEQLDEDSINRRFVVEDIDTTLERIQEYIDKYGEWEIALPKTAISYGFIAAVAVRSGGSLSEMVFIDQLPKMPEVTD